MKLGLPVWTFLLSWGVLHAQIKSDFIIQPTGDTIRGTIRFAQTSLHPTEIIFTSFDGQNVTYGPHQLKGFGLVQGAAFESHKVSRNTEGFGKITESRMPVLKTDYLFLRKIFHGAADLLVFTESSGRNHYYLRKDGIVTALISHEYLIPSYSAKANTKQYILTLRDQLKDCPGLNIPDQLSYTESDLNRVLRNYSDCSGQKSEKVKGSGGLPLLFGLTASFGKHRWITQPDPFETWKLSYGFFLESDIPSRNGKWTFLSEVLYQRQNPLGWENIRFSFLPRYYFQKSELPVFLQGGIGFSGGVGFFNVFGGIENTAYTCVITGGGVRVFHHSRHPILVDVRAEYGAGTGSKILTFSAGVSTPLIRTGR